MAGFGPPGSTGTGTSGGKWWDPRPPNPTDEALRKIAALLARYPGAELVDETHVRMPNGRIRTIQADANGEPQLSEQWTDKDSEAFLNSVGAGGTGGGSNARLTSDDPRYWDLQYRQLDQDEQQFVRDLEFRYRNAGMDAESARQQALASLIQSRNRNQIDLADTQGRIAAQAAEFAANPRDAVAELTFRNAVGNQTPFGAAFSDPNMPQYQTALQDKFQELFGPAAQSLKRAQEFLLAPPPTEFFGPEIRSQLGLQPTPAQSMAAGGSGMPAAAQPAATNPDELAGALQFIRAAQTDPRGQQGFGEDLMKWAKAFNGGVQPTTAEEGVNMNIMEPAMIVGQSGKVYATMAEKDPEQLIVKPLQSVKERQKKEKEKAKNFMKATEGITRMAEGGEAMVMPDASDFIAQLRKQLGMIGGPGGGTGSFGTALPDPRLLAGAPANALLDDPDLKAFTEAGFSSFGVSPNSLWASIKKFLPTDARYNSQTSGRVNFA